MAKIDSFLQHLVQNEGSDLHLSCGYITDRHENENQNSPPAMVMDLHNNDIGREHRYSAFRGHWLWDRWDDVEWAQRVRSYINTAANAEYIPEWNVAPVPTLSQAWAREACVPKAKYIYFAQ